MVDVRIRQLDKDIANKIAAGEVVERPLAVVKELVENAIDAGSNKITVEVKEAGKGLIRITDNGRGIEPDDMILAFERHATSKIRTINDIYNIASLGFRGEALASIASVSNIEIISKHTDQTYAKKLVLEGGKLVLDQEIGAPQGTTIMVKDLFFNTPARLKFLKSNKAEQNAINDIMNKMALSHPEVSFKYIVGGHNIFMTPGKGSMYDVIVNLYERNIWKNLIEVDHDMNGIRVKGFISTADLTRGNRQYQIAFVNNRFVKSKVVEDAINLAYRTLIPHNRFPISFININIDPSLIDINIHPAKTEIRFHQEGVIKDLVYSSITSALNQRDLTPKRDLDLKPVHKKLENKAVLNHLSQMPIDSQASSDLGLDIVEEKANKMSNPIRQELDYNKNESKQPMVQKQHNKGITSHKPQTSHDVQEKEKIRIYRESLSQLHSSSSKPASETKPGTEKVHVEPSLQRPKSAALKKEPLFVERIYEEPTPLFEKQEATIYDDLTYIGQIFNTYLIFEKKGNMYLMDQHAAHEKVLYEQYVEGFRKETIRAQLILEPITIEMNYIQYQQVKYHENTFKKLGFQMEPFGDLTMVVREIPTIFSIRTAETLIKDLIERLDGNMPDESFELVVDGLMQQSCKHAIKGHDVLDQLEVKVLVDQLKALNDPYTCPHGRPIIIAMDKKELEKKFNRI